MDAGVVTDFRPQVFAARTAAENFKNGGLDPVGPVETSRLPVATRPPQPKVRRAGDRYFLAGAFSPTTFTSNFPFASMNTTHSEVVSHLVVCLKVEGMNS